MQQGGGKVPCRGSIAALFAGAGVLMREALLFFPYKPTEIEQIIREIGDGILTKQTDFSKIKMAYFVFSHKKPNAI